MKEKKTTCSGKKRKQEKRATVRKKN